MIMSDRLFVEPGDRRLAVPGDESTGDLSPRTQRRRQRAHGRSEAELDVWLELLGRRCERRAPHLSCLEISTRLLTVVALDRDTLHPAPDTRRQLTCCASHVRDWRLADFYRVEGEIVYLPPLGAQLRDRLRFDTVEFEVVPAGDLVCTPYGGVESCAERATVRLTYLRWDAEKREIQHAPQHENRRTPADCCDRHAATWGRALDVHLVRLRELYAEGEALEAG